MDSKKTEMKNIGSKLSEQNEGNEIKDTSKELENLNKLKTSNEPQPVITIKENDIQLIKDELDITYEEAKNKLIKSQGNVKQVIETFLDDFNFDKQIYIL